MSDHSGHNNIHSETGTKGSKYQQVLSMQRVWLVADPYVMRMIKRQIDLATQVLKHVNGQANENKVSDHPTISHELLKPSSLPEQSSTWLAKLKLWSLLGK